MKGKIWTDLAAKKIITDKNILNKQLNHEHIDIKSLNSRKIFHEKQRFSTAC